MLTEDRFIEVVEAVERAGGELLAETHVGEDLEYTIEGPHGREAKRHATTTGCGAEALVQLPHDRMTARDPKGKMIELEKPESVPMRACIVDDRMDLWPRFAPEEQA